MGGPGFLAIEAVLAYCELLGFKDPDLREEWLDLLQAMDQVWHQHQAEDRKEQEQKKAEAKQRAQESQE